MCDYSMNGFPYAHNKSIFMLRDFFLDPLVWGPCHSDTLRNGFNFCSLEI